MEKTLYGNGQPGLVSQLAAHRSDFNSFCAVYADREQQREKAEKRTFNRMNLIVGIVGLILTAILGIVGLIIHDKLTAHSLLQNSQSVEVDAMKQNATVPDLGNNVVRMP